MADRASGRHGPGRGGVAATAGRVRSRRVVGAGWPVVVRDLAGVADQHGPLDRLREAAGRPRAGAPTDGGRGVPPRPAVVLGGAGHHPAGPPRPRRRRGPGRVGPAARPASSTSSGWCAPTGCTPIRSDRPPDDADRARDVKILRGDDGTGQVVVTLGDLELEEFAAAFQAFLDLRYRPPAVDESSAGDTPRRGAHRRRPAGPPRRPTPSWTWSAPPWSTPMAAAPPATTATSSTSSPATAAASPYWTALRSTPATPP